MWLLYFIHTCQKNSVFYSEICVDENVNSAAEEPTLLAWLLCESYEYLVSRDHSCCPHRVTGRNETGSCLTSSVFIQLYVNELADTLRVFNIECKYGEI